MFVDTQLKLAFLVAARDGSYSPYSSFRVGACLLSTRDSTLIAGANIENASYGASASNGQR